MSNSLKNRTARITLGSFVVTLMRKLLVPGMAQAVALHNSNAPLSVNSFLFCAHLSNRWLVDSCRDSFSFTASCVAGVLKRISHVSDRCISGGPSSRPRPRLLSNSGASDTSTLTVLSQRALAVGDKKTHNPRSKQRHLRMAMAILHYFPTFALPCLYLNNP